MSGTLKHKTLSGKADGGDATRIQPSNWNEEHTFAGGAVGLHLVRDTSATDGASWLNTGGVNVTESRFGAVGDGAANDFPAIQSALDVLDNAGGGNLIVPKGNYRLNSPLVVNTSSTFKTINILGAGSLATRFQWYGDTASPAIRVNGLKQYIFEGFVVENKVAKGTTVGIKVQRDSGTGTQSGNCVWRNIRISGDGFATGIQFGNAGISQATSEYHLDHVTLENNTTGCQVESGNSLNFVFTMLELGANGTGLNVASGGVVAIVGGSASGSTVADFNFAPAGSYSISTFRSEHANRFLTGAGTTGGTAVHVSGCTVTAIDNADNIGIRCGGLPVVLIGNDFICKVALSGQAWASSVLIGNAIANSTPVDFSVLGGTGAHYTFIGNHQVDSSNVSVGHFADEVGFVSAGVRVPTWTVTTGAQVELGDGSADVKWKKALVALGGGAAPTLGTIGGSGPAAAGQNSWMRVLDSTGAAFWVPTWK